jgi:hypothetical protein
MDSMTAERIVARVLELRDGLVADARYGPYRVAIPTKWSALFYSVYPTGGHVLLHERIGQIEGVAEVVQTYGEDVLVTPVT